MLFANKLNLRLCAKMYSAVCVCVYVCVLLSVLLHLSAAGSLYSLSAVDIHGQLAPLERYRGKVSLVVNVASECGYTDHNYRQLVHLQDLYGYRGFTVLAFPCNQFGKQEPRANREIWEFARSKYNVNFPVFAKVDVTGDGASDVYEYLTGSTGSSPTWNFCKYLVNRQGEVVQYFSQTEPFSNIKESLMYMLESHSEL